MGYVTAEQVMRRFSVGRSQAYLRLGTMCKRGLLRHSRLLVDQPGIYLPTRLGLELGAVQHLREPHVRLTTSIHQLTVVDAHLELADRLPDWRWRSERELAFAERRAGELIGSVDVLYYRADRRRRHRPDLLGPATGPRPGRRRGRAHSQSAPTTQAICRAWRRARHLSAVWYYATPGRRRGRPTRRRQDPRQRRAPGPRARRAAPPQPSRRRDHRSGAQRPRSLSPNAAPCDANPSAIRGREQSPVRPLARPRRCLGPNGAEVELLAPVLLTAGRGVHAA